MFWKRRSPHQPSEAGPIRVSTAPGLGTHWSAVVFTLAVGGALVFAGTQASQWLPLLTGGTGKERVEATPAPPTPAPTKPAVGSLASASVSQSAAPVIEVGGKAKLTFTFRNSGSATWVKGTPSEVKLGVTKPYEPSLALGWLRPDRAAIQNEAVVAPGQLATFSFEVSGAKAGKFRIDLRPVMDGVGWLTDQGVYTVIEVRGP